MNSWRTEIKDRFYRTYAYLPVDRVPDLEFGYWPQTIRRWLKEGMPVELTHEEQNQMFVEKLDKFFGFEAEGHWLDPRCGMNPWFEENIIERRANSVVMIDGTGVTAERFTHDMNESSIPHYLKFPIESLADWPAMQARFRFDDPVRELPAADIDATRQAAREGKAVHVFFCGFYGQLRHWMGMENLSLAFYDQPDLIHALVEHWAELCARQFERLPADVPVDCVSWWEDMAGRNGPLCSPAQFRELERIRPLFEQGGYIPHLDHLVPPDIPYKNYCEYLEKKRKLIGKL